MTDIDQFSIRTLTLDSAVRQAKFASDEAKVAIEELRSPKWENGKRRTIRLFRSIQKLTLDYKYIRDCFDERKEEEKLAELLKLLQREVMVYLAKYKKGFYAWQIDQVEPILIKVAELEKNVKEILSKIKRRTPKEGNFFYAGVDGGGTSSKAVIANHLGRIIGQGKAGPCFPATVGFIASFANVIQSIKKATRNAGLEFNTTYFKRVCVGVAGIDVHFDHRRLNELFYNYKRKKGLLNIELATVIQDSLLAWFSAFRGEPGIIVIGGTGDLIYGYNNGRDASNNMKGLWTDWTKVIRLGGRMIGFHTARRVKDLIKANKKTLLVQIWQDAFEKGDIFPGYKNRVSFDEMLDLVEESGSSDRVVPINQVADATRLVFGAAKRGDKDANQIIQSATESSALYIAEVAERIGLHNKRFKVAHIGSVIRNPFAMHRFKKALKELEPYAGLQKPELEPQIGAIEIARRDVRFY